MEPSLRKHILIGSISATTKNPGIEGINQAIIEKIKQAGWQVSSLLTDLEGRYVRYISQEREYEFSGNLEFCKFAKNIQFDLIYLTCCCFSEIFFKHKKDQKHLSLSEMLWRLGTPPVIYTEHQAYHTVIDHILKKNAKYLEMSGVQRKKYLEHNYNNYSLGVKDGYDPFFRAARTTLCFMHLLDTADVTVCVSQEHAEDGRKSLHGLNLERVHVIHNGTDMLKYDTDEVRFLGQKLRVDNQCDDSTVVITFVGRINYEKGIFELAQAAKSLSDDLKKEGKQVALFYIGSVTTQSAYTELTALAGTNVKVLIKNPIYDRKSLAAHFMMSDIIAQPTWGDSFNLVAAEALALGRPLVVTNDGATGKLYVETGCAEGCRIRDDWKPGQQGKIDVPHLTSVLYKIVSQGVQNEQIHRGKELVKNHYSIGAMADKYMALFKEKIAMYEIAESNFESAEVEFDYLRQTFLEIQNAVLSNERDHLYYTMDRICRRRHGVVSQRFAFLLSCKLEKEKERERIFFLFSRMVLILFAIKKICEVPELVELCSRFEASIDRFIATLDPNSKDDYERLKTNFTLNFADKDQYCRLIIFQLLSDCHNEVDFHELRGFLNHLASFELESICKKLIQISDFSERMSVVNTVILMYKHQYAQDAVGYLDVNDIALIPQRRRLEIVNYFSPFFRETDAFQTRSQLILNASKFSDEEIKEVVRIVQKFPEWDTANEFSLCDLCLIFFCPEREKIADLIFPIYIGLKYKSRFVTMLRMLINNFNFDEIKICIGCCGLIIKDRSSLENWKKLIYDCIERNEYECGFLNKDYYAFFKKYSTVLCSVVESDIEILKLFRKYNLDEVAHACERIKAFSCDHSYAAFKYLLLFPKSRDEFIYDVVSHYKDPRYVSDFLEQFPIENREDVIRRCFGIFSGEKWPELLNIDRSKKYEIFSLLIEIFSLCKDGLLYDGIFSEAAKVLASMSQSARSNMSHYIRWIAEKYTISRYDIPDLLIILELLSPQQVSDVIRAQKMDRIPIAISFVYHTKILYELIKPLNWCKRKESIIDQIIVSLPEIFEQTNEKGQNIYHIYINHPSDLPFGHDYLGFHRPGDPILNKLLNQEDHLGVTPLDLLVAPPLNWKMFSEFRSILGVNDLFTLNFNDVPIHQAVIERLAERDPDVLKGHKKDPQILDFLKALKQHPFRAEVLKLVKWDYKMNPSLPMTQEAFARIEKLGGLSNKYVRLALQTHADLNEIEWALSEGNPDFPCTLNDFLTADRKAQCIILCCAAVFRRREFISLAHYVIKEEAAKSEGVDEERLIFALKVFEKISFDASKKTFARICKFIMDDTYRKPVFIQACRTLSEFIQFSGKNQIDSLFKVLHATEDPEKRVALINLLAAFEYLYVRDSSRDIALLRRLDHPDVMRAKVFLLLKLHSKEALKQALEIIESDIWDSVQRPFHGRDSIEIVNSDYDLLMHRPKWLENKRTMRQRIAHLLNDVYLYDVEVQARDEIAQMDPSERVLQAREKYRSMLSQKYVRYLPGLLFLPKEGVSYRGLSDRHGNALLEASIPDFFATGVNGVDLMKAEPDKGSWSKVKHHYFSTSLNYVNSGHFLSQDSLVITISHYVINRLHLHGSFSYEIERSLNAFSYRRVSLVEISGVFIDQNRLIQLINRPIVKDKYDKLIQKNIDRLSSSRITSCQNVKNISAEHQLPSYEIDEIIEENVFRNIELWHLADRIEDPVFQNLLREVAATPAPYFKSQHKFCS